MEYLSQMEHLSVTPQALLLAAISTLCKLYTTLVQSGLSPPDWDGSVSKIGTGPPCGPVPIFLETVYSPV
jgi:hypothetical protein